MTRKQRLALGCYVSRWYPSGMRLDPYPRVPVGFTFPKCSGVQHGDTCGKPIEFCEHMHWDRAMVSGNPGVSFFYYCAECWTKPNFSGKSAQDRAREIPQHLNFKRETS